MDTLAISEYEQQIFGAVMLFPDKYKYLLDAIEEKDLMTHQGLQIYRILKSGEYFPVDISKKSGIRLIDIATIPNQFLNLHTLDLMAQKMVSDSAIRQAKSLLKRKIEEMPAPDERDDFYKNMIEQLSHIKQRARPSVEVSTMQDIAKEIFEELTFAMDNSGAFMKLPFPRLHETVGALVPGQIITFAGRPATGKSTIALQIAKELSKNDRVLYITLEMLGKEHLRRVISSKTGVSIPDMISGNVSSKAGEIVEELSKSKNDNLFFTSAANTPEIIEQYIKAINPNVVVVDSVNLVKNKGETERIKITNTTRELKSMATRYKIPIVQVCQLNRDAEGKTKASLSDIKESGSIEEDSDVVVLMTEITENEKDEVQAFVNEYGAKYHTNLVHPGQVDTILRKNKIIILNVAKNRNGPRRTILTAFWSRWFHFEEFPVLEDGYYKKAKEDTV